jgi:hypothetical protein
LLAISSVLPVLERLRRLDFQQIIDNTSG